MVKTADPYSPKLVVEEAKLSQADNFVGATVTYIDLTVKNTGDRTVVGGTVQAVFRDTLGQAVQTETLPLARADSSSAGRRGRGGRSGPGAAGAGTGAHPAAYGGAHLQPVEPGAAGFGIPRAAIQVSRNSSLSEPGPSDAPAPATSPASLPCHC